MWKCVYQHQFKTSQPNLIITAVQSFPNMIDTVEKAVIDYEVKENQKDPLRLEITSLYWMDNGRDFIPLYFEDDCPRLKKLPSTEFLGKSFFWCIGYRNSAIEIGRTGNRITHPNHVRFRTLLEHSLKYMNGAYAQYLFEHCVKMYVYEQSKHFSDAQKGRRFKLIENTCLKCIWEQTGGQKDYKKDYIPFLDNMYKRDWYEFVFNEYR